MDIACGSVQRGSFWSASVTDVKMYHAVKEGCSLKQGRQAACSRLPAIQVWSACRADVTHMDHDLLEELIVPKPL